MDFSKLHEDICFGRAGGKVIWQPRIDCWIEDRKFQYGELPGRYKGMNKVDIYKDLGCSARIYEYNGCFYPIYDDCIQMKHKDDGKQIWDIIITPVGTVTHMSEHTDSSWATLVKKSGFATKMI